MLKLAMYHPFRGQYLVAGEITYDNPDIFNNYVEYFLSSHPDVILFFVVETTDIF